MSIRADSYSSVADVTAFTRTLLDGGTGFNSTTRPTLSEVERLIDRASGVMNGAIAAGGFNPATVRLNSTAKLSIDDWVTARVCEHVELTQRGVGYSEGEGSRTLGFRNLHKSAAQFVGEMRLGWTRLGVSQAHSMSAGLAFTGMDAQANRADRSDPSIEQPAFSRKQFDDPTALDD